MCFELRVEKMNMQPTTIAFANTPLVTTPRTKLVQPGRRSENFLTIATFESEGFVDVFK
jgi:hypothetical protein